MNHILILGVGNILLQDEGIGVRVVEKLQQTYRFPSNVELLDGGTIGLDLINYLDDVSHLLVIDAVEAAKPPGTIIRLVNNEIPAFLAHKISPHQIGISDILSVARLRDMVPDEMVLIGIQPQSLDTGLELSPTIQARVDDLVAAVLAELKVWGVVVEQHTH